MGDIAVHHVGSEETRPVSLGISGACGG